METRQREISVIKLYVVFPFGRANMATERKSGPGKFNGACFGWKTHCQGRIFHVTHLYHCQLISQQTGGYTRYLFISSSYLSCAPHLFPFHFAPCPALWHVCAILRFCLCLAGSLRPFLMAYIHVQMCICVPLFPWAGCPRFKCFYCLLLRVKFCHCHALFTAAQAGKNPCPLDSESQILFLRTCQPANPFVLWRLIYF